MSLARGYAATKTRKVKTGICSGQDAKNAKSGSLISLRPLRRRSGHALRLCARYSESWLRLGRARLSTVKKTPSAVSGLIRFETAQRGNDLRAEEPDGAH
jgi:hypothetical protein